MNNLFLLYSVIGIFVSLGVIVLFVTFSNRKNSLIRKNLENELKHIDQLHALELTMLRDQMNPHFVHNSLNSIQYYIQRNEVEISENYISKFSKLMRQFFEHSGKQEVPLEDELELLKNYLYLEKLRFEEKLDYSIHIEEEMEIDNYSIPPFFIQPLVENAINHGIFKNKNGGQVCIKLKARNEDMFVIEIIDNGPGFDTNEAGTSSVKHSSHIIQKRIELLKSRQLFDIQINYKESWSPGTHIKLVFHNLNNA